MDKPKRADVKPTDPLLRAVLPPFSAEDLASNRAGELSKGQRAVLDSEARRGMGDQRVRWMMALVGSYLIFAPVILVVFVSPIREVLCGVAVAVCLLLLGLMWLNVPSKQIRRRRAIQAALEREDAVAAVDAQAEVIARGGYRHVSLRVNGKAIVYRRLPPTGDLLVDGTLYRVYTLPDAGLILSAEPLQDALPFAEGEPVVLRVDLPRHGLAAGASGMVVDVYDAGEGYTVAFKSPDGVPVEVFPVLPEQLGRADRA